MKMNGLIFAVCFVVALAGGYFLFSSGGTDTGSVQKESQSSEDSESNMDENAEESVVPEEAQSLDDNNCLSCHAVESLDAEGGTTGPDLSNIAEEIEDKRGMDLDSFLQNPSTTVMAGVIEDNPLDDEERERIIESLEKAAKENE